MLAFVGAKMLLVDVVKIPIALSLGIVGGLLGLSVVTSLLFPGKGNPINSQDPGNTAYSKIDVKGPK